MATYCQTHGLEFLKAAIAKKIREMKNRSAFGWSVDWPI